MPSSFRNTCLLVPLVLLTACATPTRIGGAPGIKVVGGTELPAPDRLDFGSSARPYYVGPFDKLMIDVFGIEQLAQREVQVDASGRISFPLAGVIDVTGLTPAEIEQIVTVQLRQAHVRDPQVTVNLREMVSQRITVEGEVGKPGIYPVIGKLTLLRAVALAEGTTEFSRLKDVVVFRTVNGERLAALFDLNAVRHGVYADPEIYPGDIVMVGESRGRRMFKDLIQTLPVLTGPLIVAVDRVDN